MDGGQQEEVEDDCRFLAGVTGWVAALLLRQGNTQERNRWRGEVGNRDKGSIWGLQNLRF